MTHGDYARKEIEKNARAKIKERVKKFIKTRLAHLLEKKKRKVLGVCLRGSSTSTKTNLTYSEEQNPIALKERVDHLTASGHGMGMSMRPKRFLTI